LSAKILSHFTSSLMTSSFFQRAPHSISLDHSVYICIETGRP
jgi:hypothetical protein